MAAASPFFVKATDGGHTHSGEGAHHTPKLAEPYHPEYIKTGVKAALEEIEGRMANRLKQWFAELIRHLCRDEVRKVNVGQVLAVMDDGEWWQFESDLLQQILTDGSLEAAAQGKQTVERQLGMSLSWDYLQPAVTDWAAGNAGQLVSNVTDGIKDDIRSQILQGLSDGKTVFDIRDELQNLTDEQGQQIFSQSRAETIARTEVIRAHTQGAIKSYIESGVVRGLKWLDGQSGACMECQALNGVIKPIGEPFFFDPTFGDGQLPRHPNCRCAIAPVTIDEAKKMEDPALNNDLRDSIEQLTDINTYTNVNGVRVTGERLRHWTTRHPETIGFENEVVNGLLAEEINKTTVGVQSIYADLHRVSSQGRPLYLKIIISLNNGEPFVLTSYITTQIEKRSG